VFNREDKRIRELEKKLKDTEMEHEILKKAILNSTCQCNTSPKQISAIFQDSCRIFLLKTI
jgi:hypothetical protein